MEIQRGFYQSGLGLTNYIGVPPHAYAIVSGSLDRTSLFACNVLSNLVVTIYAQREKMGALLHIDYDQCNTIRTVFQEFTKAGAAFGELEVQIIGGSSEGTFGIAESDKKFLKRLQKLMIL